VVVQNIKWCYSNEQEGRGKTLVTSERKSRQLGAMCDLKYIHALGIWSIFISLDTWRSLLDADILLLPEIFIHRVQSQKKCISCPKPRFTPSVLLLQAERGGVLAPGYDSICSEGTQQAPRKLLKGPRSMSLWLAAWPVLGLTFLNSMEEWTS
jgi:hypothetical protein